MANFNNQKKKIRFKLFVETQTRKIVSAYGGVGSIYETRKGAVKIENFDKWFFPENSGHIVIDDERLVQRLRYDKAFSQLKYLFQVPNSSRSCVVSASFFPEWFFCSNCNRFKIIKDWFKEWKKVQEKHGITDIDSIKDSFIPPKCFYCFDKAKEKNEPRKYYELEQTRFIMTASNGKIRDIPWEYWTTAIKAKPLETDNSIETEDDEKSSKIKITFKTCCEKQDLRYKQSEKFEDLRGINVVCVACNKRNTLTGLFGLRLSDNNNNDHQEKSHFKPVVRSSNSVYYPILVNSLYLPISDINQSDKEKINKWVDKGKDTDFIYDALEEKYSKQEIDGYINNNANIVHSEYIAEMDYRRGEYAFIYNNHPEYQDKHLRFQWQNLTEQYRNWGIDALVKVSRLKMTSVQTGYTRQEPLDIDTFLNEDYQENKIKPQYTSNYGKNTQFLPAIESLGEGIFISFNADKIKQWINQDIQERMAVILKNSQYQDSAFFKKKLKDVFHAAKFILIHTFSHILIKELEFLCGYSAISLNERLYIDGNIMQGVLIYTVAGAEGSYGGLITQAEPDKLAWIIESALQRAKECSSDPVCYHAEEQGVGGLNLAACYSCALLPETSCEELNCFLDRRLLIDENYGFLINTV
jgi:hypothetical protein